MNIEHLKKELELAWSTYRYTSKILKVSTCEVDKRIDTTAWNFYLDAVQVYYKKLQT